METTGWQKVNQVLGSLRTCKVGEQCENIVKLPTVFEDYPFPILIDAAFLKLGDIFRECNNNFIRFCILKVMVASAQHHTKLTGKEIFLRPVLSVMHSNDAVARAITLRVLGVTATLFPEKRNVLHVIVRALDSYMELERDAALFACKQYAAMSQDVSKTVVPKLEELMSSLSTTEALKIKILDVFQSMNYDLDTCCQVRNVCLKMVAEQSTERITDGCLKTLTQMAVSTLSAPRDVLDLLLQLASNEPRKSVRHSAFKCLEKIAGEQPGLINEGDVRRLAMLTEESGADILYKISCSSARHTLTPPTLQLLSNKLHTVPLPTAVAVYQTCAALLPPSETQIHFYPLLVRAINTCNPDNSTPGNTRATCSNPGNTTLLVRRLLLSYSRQSVVNTDLLFTLMYNCTHEIFVELCYCVSSLRHSVVLQPRHISGVLEHCTGHKKGCYFVKLLTVLFCQCDAQLRTQIIEHVSHFVEQLAQDQALWAMYCIGRVALCNGVFEVALQVSRKLRELAAHPYTQNYFHSLELVCCAELADSLTQTIDLYHTAITTVKCCKNSSLTHFQADCLLLRLRLLKIYLQLINLSNIAHMCGQDATASYAPTLRFINKQVQELAVSVRELETRMIDARRLDNLQELLLLCSVLGMLCSGEVTNSAALPHSPTAAQCAKALAVLKDSPEAINNITFIRQTVDSFVALRFNLPLFYFVQEHSTSISIATSPAIDQGIIKIAGGCSLLLAVEAVVRGNTSRIHHLLVDITCDKSKSAKTGKGEERVVLLDQEVAVLEGYLKLEVDIVVTSYSDVYTITARAVDSDDRIWNIGSKVSFRVKTDDSVLSKSQLSKAYV